MKKAQAAEMRKRKLCEEEELSCCSSSLVKLKRPRKIADMVDNSDDLCASPSSDHALSYCYSSNVANEKLTSVDLQDEDEEASSAEITLSTTYSVERIERRETSASSKLQTVSTELDSTAPRNSKENSSCRATTVKMPSDAELHDFFSAAEKDLQEKFAQKYNFDIEKEEPFEGLKEIFRFGEVEDLGKYLGLPTVWKRSLTSDLDWIMDRISSKLAEWRCKFLSDSGLRTWNDVLIRRLFEDEVANQILSIYIPQTHMADKLVWHSDPKGICTVKTAYQWCYNMLYPYPPWIKDRASTSINVPDGIWDRVWKWCTMPKIRNFLWKCIWDALPCQMNRFKRRCSKNAVCEICGLEDESIEHALLYCDWARKFWFAYNLQLLIIPRDVKRLDLWLMDTVNRCTAGGYSKKEAECTIAFGLWNVWKERCKATIEGLPVNLHRTIQIAINDTAEFLTCHGSDPQDQLRHESPTTPSWPHPPRDHWAISVDASFHADGRAAMGFIVRDEDGRFITGNAKKIRCGSAEEAEAQALLFAVDFAKECSNPRIIFQNDAKRIWEAVTSQGSHINWMIDPIIEDIQKIASSQPLWIFHHIGREVNRPCDWIVRQCASSKLDPMWVSTVPRHMLFLLSCDSPRLGIG